MIDIINRWIAVNMTLAMGSIWAFYGFVIFGLIPVIIPSVEPSLLYWSNFIQLIFLPVIMVGQNVLGASTIKRAQQDHESLQKLVIEMNSLMRANEEELKQLKALMSSQ